jgi:hypothetical protein
MSPATGRPWSSWPPLVGYPELGPALFPYIHQQVAATPDATWAGLAVACIPAVTAARGATKPAAASMTLSTSNGNRWPAP